MGTRAQQQRAVGDGSDSRPQLRAIAGGGAVADPASQVDIQTAQSPETLQDMIAMFNDHKEMIIAAQLHNDIACVTLKPGHFEFKAYETAPPALAGRVRKSLADWTGQTWMVSVVKDAGSALSLAEMDKQVTANAQEDIKSHPNVKAILNAFPDAEIVNILDNNE